MHTVLEVQVQAATGRARLRPGGMADGGGSGRPAASVFFIHGIDSDDSRLGGAAVAICRRALGGVCELRDEGVAVDVAAEARGGQMGGADGSWWDDDVLRRKHQRLLEVGDGDGEEEGEREREGKKERGGRERRLSLSLALSSTSVGERAMLPASPGPASDATSRSRFISFHAHSSSTDYTTLVHPWPHYSTWAQDN